MGENIAGNQSTPQIILYDGICGLCDRFVRFVLKRDKHDRFRFASLQSEFASTILQRHGINPQILDTTYLVRSYNTPQEHLLARNDAVVAVFTELGGIWKIWAWLLQLLPKSFRNWRYNLVARYRYRIFGKYNTCPLPDPKDRHKFFA